MPGRRGTGNVRSVTTYDTIGRTYTATRATEPRYAERIWAVLGDAAPVLNVGAGTGSYERRDRPMIAVEPSSVMIAQRPAGAAPAVQGVAERLPFADGAFGGAMAVLTVHHWTDPAAGLAEMRRVTRGPIVIVGTDIAAWFRSWLGGYFHDMADLDGEITADETAALLGADRVEVLETPHDCRDGFFGAYWRRPEAYLDPIARDGISTFDRMGPDRADRFVRELADDLESGVWLDRNADLLEADSYDIGHRLVIVDGS